MVSNGVPGESQGARRELLQDATALAISQAIASGDANAAAQAIANAINNGDAAAVATALATAAAQVTQCNTPMCRTLQSFATSHVEF